MQNAQRSEATQQKADNPQLAAAVAAGQKKAAMPPVRRGVLSVLAGLFIGLGASVMLVVKADGTLSFGVCQLAGGLGFSLGLFLVFVAGAELFTGNSLLVIGALEGRYPLRAMLKNWAFVYLGNLTGSLLLSVLLLGAGFASMGGGAAGEAAVAVAAAKATLAPGTVFFRAVLCNVLVCLAVWMSFSARSVTEKLCCAVLPVAAFVACGFEHCVANMFFLPFGLLAAAASGVEAAGLTVGACALNILVATLGNVLGGVAVGVAYHLAWGRGQGARP